MFVVDSQVHIWGAGVPGNPAYRQITSYRNIHTYLRQIYDAFGPECMFWGTDITRMPCSWQQCGACLPKNSRG